MRDITHLFRNAESAFHFHIDALVDAELRTDMTCWRVHMDCVYELTMDYPVVFINVMSKHKMSNSVKNFLQGYLKNAHSLVTHICITGG